jgi:hypothetical protein
MEQQGGGIRRLQQRRRRTRGRAPPTGDFGSQTRDRPESSRLFALQDFENYTKFKSAAHHEKSLSQILDQLIAWSGALKPLRA